ncbi:hypothetical protein GIB67_016365 [Kingdonia uniflora]|uniref:Uncharacterized protein n=1 Tax=Kingdonia uniflora TaxID=39325 RepID=A0A7J7PBI9_9MAGN|nr:hypothetical protein GIB67_016365 [Kingdonia uniflora]
MLMTNTDDSKKKWTDGERLENLPKAPEVDCTGLPESITSKKLARAFPKKKMLKHPSASGTTGSGEAVERTKRRRVEPSEISGVKFIEDRLVVEDDWKKVEEKAKLAALRGVEDMSIMAARLMKGICLGVEEERAELKRKKVEFERNVARLKSYLSKEGKLLEALKASQVVEINKLHVEARVDLEEVVAEEDEVDAIRADTYIEEEEDEKNEDVAVGIVDGLDGVSPQMVSDNQGDDNEHPELENDKELKDIRLRIKYLEAELAMEMDLSVPVVFASRAAASFRDCTSTVELEAAYLRDDDARQCNQEFAEEFDIMREANEDREGRHVKVHFKFVEDMEFRMAQRKCNELNERVAQLKTELAHANSRVKNAEAGERSKKNINNPKVFLVPGDVLSSFVRIRDLEGDVARIQGHARKGVEQLRECQIKLDAALIMKKGLERVISGKEIVIFDKEEFLKKILDMEELNKENEILRAQVVDLKATNRAESVKVDKIFAENIAFTDLIDREMVSQNARYKRLEDRLQRSRTIFSHSVVTQASHSELLRW